MFCTKCGHKSEGEVDFCTQCGARMSDAASEQTENPPNPLTKSDQMEAKMWKYMLLEETNEKKLVEKLNELGRANWEAVAYTIAMGAMGKGHHFVLLKQKIA